VKNALGCDSIIYTLDLTILPDVDVKPVDEATICYGEIYTWFVNNEVYDQAGQYKHVVKNALGCDSIIYTLDLTILSEVVYVAEDTVALCAESTYEWRGKSFNQAGTYRDTIYNSLGCDSVIYTLNLIQYVNTIPTIIANDIVAICGKAIDVTNANAGILAHIAGEAQYAPNVHIKWYVLNGNTYDLLTNIAIDGNSTEVTVKYTITTDCGVVESEPIVVKVSIPSPENDDALADIPAYNKYGGRLFTIDLKYINEQLGLDVTEDEVTWYLVVEGGEDEVQGKGYYLTTEDGTPLPAGEYYARISKQGQTDSDCDLILQTIIVIVETHVGPLLAPTVASPNELLRLLNLDANTTSTISVYSSTGQMLDSFQVKDAKEISFEAAHVAGYYIVEIQTESGKVSLRYVVK
jgi:hypothetical protein